MHLRVLVVVVFFFSFEQNRLGWTFFFFFSFSIGKRVRFMMRVASLLKMCFCLWLRSKPCQRARCVGFILLYGHFLRWFFTGVPCWLNGRNSGLYIYLNLMVISQWRTARRCGRVYITRSSSKEKNFCCFFCFFFFLNGYTRNCRFNLIGRPGQKKKKKKKVQFRNLRFRSKKKTDIWLCNYY